MSHSSIGVIDYGHQSYPPQRSGSSLARIGGAIAVAGTLIGCAIFLGGCAGYGASFALSPIPLILGILGFALTLVGGFFSHEPGLNDGQMVAAYAINLAVVLGALLLMAVWRGWTIFVL